MFSNCYLGAPCGLHRLRSRNEALSARVLDQVSSNQELVTLNRFEHQSSEYLLRKCLQERISDLESWRWVLQDLSNRLNELIESLRYEHNALRVVVGRVQEEISRHSENATRPGALTPQSDPVEEAIYQEYNFFQEQKKRFAKMISDLDKEIPALEKVKKRLETDALNKEHAIDVDEKLSDLEMAAMNQSRDRRRKKSVSPLARWESRCNLLKKKGLCALSNALSIRQQVRGCRYLLSVAAQSYASRVDSLLRRRLYLNTRKLEELQWEKDEAQKDFKSLSDELTSTEQSVIDTMDKIKLMEARLADRRLRPPKELTKDGVDRKLREELNRLKQCLKRLRSNIDRITSLQGDLTASITQMNCVEDDIAQVVRLDQDRIRCRAYEDEPISDAGLRASVDRGSRSNADRSASTTNEPRNTATEVIVLTTIQEEDESAEEEEDDYPFDF